MNTDQGITVYTNIRIGLSGGSAEIRFQASALVGGSRPGRDYASEHRNIASIGSRRSVVTQ